jgi:hypothetical protein
MRSRIEEAGLADRSEWLSDSAFDLLFGWVSPHLDEYAHSDAVVMAGGISIADKDPDEIRELLREYRARLGERVCLIWRFDHGGVIVSYDDFCERYDDLWYPSSDDVYVISSVRRRFLIIDHEEIVLFRGVDD